MEPLEPTRVPWAQGVGRSNRPAPTKPLVSNQDQRKFAHLLCLVENSRDHTARVLDAQTGEPLTLPLRTGAEMMTAIFSPGASSLLVASKDGSVQVFDMPPQEPPPRGSPIWLSSQRHKPGITNRMPPISPRSYYAHGCLIRRPTADGTDSDAGILPRAASVLFLRGAL